MVTKQVWITLQAGFWLQIFVEGNIYEKKIICILLPFPYEIFKVTPLLAGLQHKQPFHPSGFTQESPARLQRTWTKKLEPCHLKPDTHDHKNSTNTVLVYSYPTPFCFHQWRSEMCDFVCKSCFIHWDSIIENHLHISGYHLTARNPTTGPHGGVSLYIKNNSKFKSLEYLQDPDFETMWTWLQPTRLPRGITLRIALTVNDMAMLKHLATTSTSFGGQFPGCGIFLCGDFKGF